MTTAQIQESILTQTGIKTSVKKLTGSMKQHIRFAAMLQNGLYPKFDFTWRNQFKNARGFGNFADDYSIDIHIAHIEPGEPMQFKRERKPKTIDEMSVKRWGSKNSQMRLDKATRRNAKKLRAGTTARYW